MIQEILQYYAQNSSYVFDQVMRHFLMAFYGVIFGTLFCVPLGFYVARKEKLSRFVRRLGNIIQTVPALAMLSLLIALTGVGANTVVVAIFLYSILPILSNTITGVNNVQNDVIDVAKGMGMTPFQILWRVELPLSISFILGGVRNALVVGIGVAAVGTFIGAGGLGDIISRGINVADGSSIIWAGALPTALMAFVSDRVLSRVEKSLIQSS